MQFIHFTDSLARILHLFFKVNTLLEKKVSEQRRANSLRARKSQLSARKGGQVRRREGGRGIVHTAPVQSLHRADLLLGSLPSPKFEREKEGEEGERERASERERERERKRKKERPAEKEREDVEFLAVVSLCWFLTFRRLPITLSSVQAICKSTFSPRIVHISHQEE